MRTTSGGPSVAALFLVIVIILALGNLLLFSLALQQLCGAGAGVGGAIRLVSERAPAYLVYLTSAHLLAGLVALVAVRLLETPPAGPAAASPTEEQPAVERAAPALRLLALLQAEGRFIDFLEEDIEQYSDAQVGAAVRSIHAGCRKALHERMRIERIYPEEDGSEIEVGPAYDPATLRLTGNVHGQPPFRGMLQHSGWRATEVHLPAPPTGFDAGILAPAEVEIP
jgi:hypothetical protein